MNTKDKDKKYFLAKLDKELWAFLKKRSAVLEIPMSDIINFLVKKEKESIESS